MTALTVFISVLLFSIIVIQSKKFLIEVEEDDKENSTVKTVNSKKDDWVMRYKISNKISHIWYQSEILDMRDKIEVYRNDITCLISLLRQRDIETG